MQNMVKEVKRIKIAEDVFMPIIGIGTWEILDKTVLHNVLDAGFDTSYRLIDTAHSYFNETFIGESLKQLMPKYNLSCQDIFITTKTPCSKHGKKMTHEAVLASLKNLQMDFLDLVLVHYPGAEGVDKSNGARLKELRRETWLELEKLKEEGKVRAIGVSNYMVNHLEEMNEYATIKPAVNQCEFHPHTIYQDVMDYCKKHGIFFQAYSSLGTSQSNQILFKEPLVTELSEKYKCEPAQLLLAWALNQDVGVIPKSTKVEHVKTNFRALDLIIEKSDVELLAKLSRKAYYCDNPVAVA